MQDTREWDSDLFIPTPLCSAFEHFAKIINKITRIKQTRLWVKSISDSFGWPLVDGTIDTTSVFRGATTLAMEDGHLDDQEMRILARLSHALRLAEGLPLKIYDNILEGRDSDPGREISRSEALMVYGQVLEAYCTISEPTPETALLLSYMRTVFDINETEHREFVRSVDRHLEQVVHRNVAAQLRTTIDDAIELVSDPLQKLRIRK